MKVAITGSAGFVGSWISQKALSAGFEVIGIDNLSSNINYTQKGVQFHQVDLNDKIDDLLKNVDFVVHAAAYAEIHRNWKDSLERKKLFQNNEIATLNLLEQMPEVPIIYLSSASVYGSKSLYHDVPLKEEDASAQTIESPYAASKLACESYLSAYAYKRNTPWYALRLVNQVGSRIHRGVIVDFCKKATNMKHIHALDNGKQKKNWTSVEDTADVIIHIIKNKIPSGIYTVSSDERWSWWDIVEVMKKMYKEKYSTNEDPFSVTYEDKWGGSIGDPVNLNINNNKLKKYFACSRPVEQAVKEALLFNGWTS